MRCSPGAISFDVLSDGVCQRLTDTILAYHTAHPNDSVRSGNLLSYEGLALDACLTAVTGCEWIVTANALTANLNSWLQRSSTRRLTYAHGVAIMCQPPTPPATATATATTATAPLPLSIKQSFSSFNPVARVLHSSDKDLGEHIDRWDLVLNININRSADCRGGDLLLAARSWTDPHKKYSSAPLQLPSAADLQFITKHVVPVAPKPIIKAESAAAKPASTGDSSNPPAESAAEIEYKRLQSLKYYVYEHQTGRALCHAGGQIHRSRRVHSGRRINLLLGFQFWYRFEHWNRLSPDLQVRVITHFLKLSDVASLMRVSQSFRRNYSANESLWRGLWTRDVLKPRPPPPLPSQFDVKMSSDAARRSPVAPDHKTVVGELKKWVFPHSPNVEPRSAFPVSKLSQNELNLLAAVGVVIEPIQLKGTAVPAGRIHHKPQPTPNTGSTSCLIY